MENTIVAASILFPTFIVAACVMLYCNIRMHRRLKRVRQLAMQQARPRRNRHKKLYLIKSERK